MGMKSHIITRSIRITAPHQNDIESFLSWWTLPSHSSYECCVYICTDSARTDTHMTFVQCCKPREFYSHLFALPLKFDINRFTCHWCIDSLITRMCCGAFESSKQLSYGSGEMVALSSYCFPVSLIGVIVAVATIYFYFCLDASYAMCAVRLSPTWRFQATN